MTRICSLLIISLLFGWVMLAPSFCWAEGVASGNEANNEPVKTDDKKMEVELPDMEVKGERTVESATLTETPVIELPQSVETVGRKMIESLGLTRFVDAWHYMSGVMLTEAPFVMTISGGAAMVRGFGSTESTVNGFPVSKEMGMYLDAANIESIEFFKGSEAAIKGSYNSRAGVGGSINIVTKNPLDESLFDTEFQLRASGDEWFRAQADYNQPFMNGDLLFRVNGVLETQSPFYLPSGLNSEAEIFVAPVMSWNTGDNVEMTFELSYQNQNMASYYGVPVVRGECVSDYDEYYGDDDTRTLYEGTIAQWRIAYDIDDNSTLNANISWAKMTLDVDLLGLSFGASGDPLTYFDTVYNTKTSLFTIMDYKGDNERLGAGVNLVSEGKIGKTDNTFVVGLDAVKIDSATDGVMSTTTDWYDVDGPVIPDNPPVTTSVMSNESTTRKNGIFVQDQIAWDSWRILAGIRFDKHDSGTHTGENLSNRIGATYLFSSEFSLYTAYTDTEGPNLGMVDSGGVPITEDWSAKQFEIGIKKYIVEDLMLTAAIFNIYQNNLPEMISPGVYELTGKMESRGLELAVQGNINADWSMQASYTFQLMDDFTDDDQYYQNLPEHSFALWQTYKIPSGKLENLKIGLGYKYVSERDVLYRGQFLSDDYVLPQYSVVDLMFEYPLPQEDANIRVNIGNIFNIEYFDSVRHCKGNPGEPRSIMVSYNAKF